MTTTTYAIDATSSHISSIPANTPYVIGYVSGTRDIEWNPEDFLLFPASHVIKNYQGYDYPQSLTDSVVDSLHELDVENGALLPTEAAHIIALRVARGWQWTTIYGTDATLAKVAQATQALGAGVWVGHVLCRLADWDLNEQEAAAKVGTQIHGITCVGVQWASPTSNPHTILGTVGKTLSELQVDLSIVDLNWINLVTQRHTTAPVPAARTGILVELPNGPALTLHSTDGKTWS